MFWRIMKNILRAGGAGRDAGMAAFIAALLLAGLLSQECSASAHSGDVSVPSFSKEDFIATAGSEPVLDLTLTDCITQAFRNNSEIQVKKISPKLRMDDVKIAWSEFEPSLIGGYNLYYNAEKPANLFFQGESKTRDITANVGIGGKLVTGTQYNVGLDFDRYWSNSIIQTINPAYRVEPKVTITQPLFRGFGIDVNEANVHISKNNKLMSDQDFLGTVIDIITRTKNVYYLYFYTMENRSIAALALERAESLLEINRARYAKGLASSVDLLETEATVSDREKNFISSEKALQKAEDDLKFVTNIIDDPAMWNSRLELANKPRLEAVEVGLVEALEAAFKHRPDYKAAALDLKNRDIQVVVTKNGLLPIIDLKGSFGLNGIDRNTARALKKIDTDYEEWNLGAQVTIPFGMGDRARYDQAKLQKKQALTAFKRLEQAIILEVRDKVRNVEIQYRVVKAAELALEKERENYAAQSDRYAAGQVSTHDMLDYQDKLSRAELDQVRALVDYNIILAELDKVRGVTLESNGIILEEK